MLLSRGFPFSVAVPSRARLARALRRAAGLLLVLLLAYAAWQGYRNPDLLLDLAAFRLC
jgi:hypothetical protein